MDPKIVSIFFYFCIVVGLAADYDEILARYKIWPMAAASYSDHPELCVKDNFANADFKQKYIVQCDLLKNDTCFGFSAVSHSDKSIILSFRGSNGALQITNEVIDELLDPPSPFVGGGGVNKYFLDAFNKIWNAGMKDDFNTVKNSNPGYEVWVTGHSLGAAMASIAAATISQLKYMSSDKIKLVTFGQPRVGNAKYAAAADVLVPYAFRIVHLHDLVPHLPPKGMLGYIHHKSEVWYPNAMQVNASYVVCDEDEGSNCSDSNLDLDTNVIDELLDPPSPFVGGGGVNKYFLDAFNKIWNAGMKDDFNTMKNSNPGYELWITGHSLGAAMASIAAATISQLKYMPSDKIKLVTFGQPRVGNAKYAAAADVLVPYAFRIVHLHDLVPHLPPKGMLGYIHHKSEVWYPNAMQINASYVVCDEDEGSNCSDSNLDLDTDDHDHYFNVDTDFADQRCKGYNPYH
uniref:Fungal lipase-like domain-containing protein n=1 Tax=Panagrolaimus sp. JU765 TaxID=591449 RepID=A0AC34Q263_9BILA